MEGSDANHSPAPFPLGQRQLPVPFILPQQLGPLPLPDRGPATSGLQCDWAQAHAVSPSPELYPWLEVRTPSRRHVKAQDGLPHYYQLPSPAFGPEHRLSPVTSSAALLPPPVPTSSRPRGSPQTRQPSDQARVASKDRTSLQSSALGSWASSAQKAKNTCAGVRGHTYELLRYKCGRCPETFASNLALRNHKKIHLERRYPCSCGAAYTEVSTLRVSPTGCH